MKGKVFAIFLLVVFTFPVALKGYRIVHFLINQDEIAASLCINKAKPVNHCKGNCHLRSELKKADNTESVPVSKNQFQPKEKAEEFLPSVSAIVAYISELTVHSTLLYYPMDLADAHSPGVFRPPC